MKPLRPDSATDSRRSITLGKFLQGRSAYLGIGQTRLSPGWRELAVGSHVKTRHYLTKGRYYRDGIVIYPPSACERLRAMDKTRLRDYLRHLAAARTALVIFARCPGLPREFKDECLYHGLPVMLSHLHEATLESRLRAIIWEKIRGFVMLHGVALEYNKKALIITGPGGIGKTTAALSLIRDEGSWIADDVAVVRKKQDGGVSVGGHPRVKKYLHTAETGIVAVGSLLERGRIKKTGTLHAIIDVIRTGDSAAGFSTGRKIIMGKSLPCVRVHIPADGYFDKNMLIMALQTLER